MKPITHLAVALVTCASMACATSGTPVPTGRPNSPSGTTASSEPTRVNNENPGSIPVGQEMDVRLQGPLSSETAKLEQRFETTTIVDLVQNDRVLVPAGSVVRGIVSGVTKAGRVERAGALTLSFDQMTVNRQTIPIRASAIQVFESGGLREDGTTAGVGAGVGGIIGGVLGGVQGALIGAVIGAGGAVAATDGNDIELPSGTIVRIRLDSAASVP
jgi:hypothetical protein